jgi:hypothetical protein
VSLLAALELAPLMSIATVVDCTCKTVKDNAKRTLAWINGENTPSVLMTNAGAKTWAGPILPSLACKSTVLKKLATT